MEEKEIKKAYLNELLTSGFVLGLLYAVQIFGAYYLNGESSYNWLFFLYGILVLAYCQIYFGRRAATLKDAVGGGYSYIQALGFSIKMLLLSGLIYGFASWLLSAIIDPAYGDLLRRMAMENAMKMAPNSTDEQVEIMRATANFMTGVWGMMLSSMLTMLINGGFVALITSAFIKRKPDIFIQNG